MSKKSRASGFTLVELLVVIGIIALLISILLPALNRVKQQANRLVCQSNMRQIAIGVMTYVADNKGYMPFPNWGDTTQTSPYSIGWLFTGGGNHGGWTGAPWNAPNLPEDGGKTGALYKYLKTTKVYHCVQDIQSEDSGTEHLTSYLMNGAVCGYNPPKWFKNGAAITPGDGIHPAYRLSAFKRPSEKVMMWEAAESSSSTGAPWNDGSSYPTEELLSQRHHMQGADGANLSFFDSHVEWWPIKEFTRQENLDQDKGGKLWANPMTVNGRE